jgi:DNA polymerase-3 subunit delta
VILPSLEGLERDIQKNGLRSIYLILGAEPYQCRAAIKLLRARAISAEAEAFDYSEFSAGDVSIDEIIKAANTFPMISPKRLTLVNETEKLKDYEQDALLGSLTALSSRSILILYATELDRRKKFYKTLREKHCVAELNKLKGIALERWAEAFLRQQGYRISSSGIKKLVELVGSDLQTLASELEKVTLFAGKEKNISNNTIENLVRTSRQHGIFELIGAVGRRDRKAALSSLANLLSTGEHPLAVVAMMARHCRQVLIAKEYILEGRNAREIASVAQIPQFILEQFLRQARAVDFFAIQEMYVRLADIDRKLKTSAGDGRMLLEHLICALV